MNLSTFPSCLIIICFLILLKQFDIIYASLKIEYGLQLLNALLTTIIEVSIRECIRNCDVAVQCRSINYLPSFRICQLNYQARGDEDVMVISNAGSIYYERKNENNTDINRKMRNPCEDHVDKLYKNGECASFIDCGPPPMVVNAAIVQNDGTAFMSKVMYTCEEDMCQEGIPYIGCQSDRRWSPVRFRCKNRCPDNWFTIGQSCYVFEKKFLTWDDAERYCRKSDAYLAEISAGEFSFLLSIIEETESAQLQNSCRVDSEEYPNKIYVQKNIGGLVPRCLLRIKETTESDRSASYMYLDILLSFHANGHLNTLLYDKRDDCSFHITNFPFMSSNIPSFPAYGVFVSQLIRHARACSKYEDFIIRARRLARNIFVWMGSIQKIKEGDWRWVHSNRTFNLPVHDSEFAKGDYLYVAANRTSIYLALHPHFLRRFVCERLPKECKLRHQ